MTIAFGATHKSVPVTIAPVLALSLDQEAVAGRVGSTVVIIVASETHGSPRRKWRGPPRGRPRWRGSRGPPRGPARRGSRGPPRGHRSGSAGVIVANAPLPVAPGLSFALVLAPRFAARRPNGSTVASVVVVAASRRLRRREWRGPNRGRGVDVRGRLDRVRACEPGLNGVLATRAHLLFYPVVRTAYPCVDLGLIK